MAKIIRSEIRELAGFSVEVQRRARQKHIYLHILPPDGNLRLTCSTSVPEKRLADFLASKRKVILRQQSRLRQRQVIGARTYQSGEVHPLWGRPYRLEFVDSGPVYRIDEIANCLYLRCREDADLERRKKRLDEVYRSEVQKKLPQLCPELEARVGQSASEYLVRKYRRRWGSCQVFSRKISLSLELAKYPEICLRHVILHELVHLIEANHGRGFYALLHQLDPDMSRAEALLKSSAYDFPAIAALLDSTVS
ncbi:MAG: SprT family zinc-dependent metalloprotease [Eubacteriales bacterium]|nr:SprT family zinc-dependent metalloprotease [Eubacteriales bacterium]